MCLILKENKKLIAEEDIVCYKVVTASPESKIMRTPFQEALVKLNEIYHSDLIVEKHWRNDGTIIINYGIHSFITKEYALDLLNKPNFYKSKYDTIVECIIPKNSEYYEGIFELVPSNFDLINSYASNQLTYKTIIE